MKSKRIVLNCNSNLNQSNCARALNVVEEKERKYLHIDYLVKKAKIFRHFIYLNYQQNL